MKIARAPDLRYGGPAFLEALEQRDGMKMKALARTERYFTSRRLVD